MSRRPVGGVAQTDLSQHGVDVGLVTGQAGEVVEVLSSTEPRIERRGIDKRSDAAERPGAAARR